MRIQRAVVTVEIIPPNICDKHFACEGDVAVVHHVKQQVVFLRRQIGTHAVHRDNPSGKIDCQAFRPEQLVLRYCGALHTAHHSSNAHHQFFRRERLHDIIVHAEFKAVDLIILLAACGKHDDGRRCNLLNLRHGRKTVKLRHHHIHDDNIERIGRFAEQAHRLHAVFRFRHLVPLKLRVFTDEQANFRFIVHD